MKDVLDLYEEPYDPKRPLVCFDESLKQLIAEVRETLPVEPGSSPARYDTEYERKGVCYLMMICEYKHGFRQVDVTDRRTKIEFAHSMRPFPPNKHGNWQEDWNSTTPQKWQLAEYCNNRTGGIVE